MAGEGAATPVSNAKVERGRRLGDAVRSEKRRRAHSPRNVARFASSCSELVACERGGRFWNGKLMAAAPDGRWTVPCVEAHPRGVSACKRAVGSPRRHLAVFTHLPKAGGTSLGEWLSASFRSQSPLEACRVLWNGQDAPRTRARILEWMARRPAGSAPALPMSLDGGLGAENATLASAVPLSRCSFLWAQHMDYSIVQAIRLAQPRLVVHAIMFVRHPASLFFSEYLYKRHCLWRQQGLPAPPPSVSRTLAMHIERLRSRPGQRSLLTRFLAGASWCSCAADLLRRRKWSSAQMRRRALRNAAQYAFIGILERYNESMHLLRRSMGAGALGVRHMRDLAHADSAPPVAAHMSGHLRSNSLKACVSQEGIPSSDFPTTKQRAEVFELLRDDVQLYLELEHRLLRQL